MRINVLVISIFVYSVSISAITCDSLIGQTTSGFLEQQTPTPERCWNTTVMRRPSYLVTPSLEKGLTLLSCQTYCTLDATCIMIAYSSSKGTCRHFNRTVAETEWSMDPNYVILTPTDCGYEYSYHRQKENWMAAKDLCMGYFGQLASIMSEDYITSMLTHIPYEVSEVWIGLRYSETMHWKWLNGMNATAQRYFKRSEYQVSTDYTERCAKAAVSNTTYGRAITIIQESCAVELPFVCQFKTGVLPTITTTRAKETAPPFEQSDLFKLFILTTTPDFTTIPFLSTTYTIPTIPPAKPTLRVPLPVAPTSAPFTNNPLHVALGTSMAFIAVGFIALIVVADMATIGKEFETMRKNLRGCWRNFTWPDDYGEYPDQLAESGNSESIQRKRDEPPNWHLPASAYQSYDQHFMAV